ncbi:MarR family winged helix-turn-helix transcriptional regulator [Qaidamihabitans albus]|uniref:MarR family winged helix-turn-helix transcriptional regulator n=1 Tax=Qaidamihabitans albus TaxID=2795733 RepID=UPI0018F22347|nr:MarR family transcriptional regulator [Qaidamihabitans albus]
MTRNTADVDAYRLLMADVYELAGESRRSSEAIARELGQTAARWHVLSVVSDRPRTVAGAARRLGLARQSVQRVVDDLVADGQVELRPNPADQRARLVALSMAGRHTLAELQCRSATARAALLDRAALGSGELEHARATLRALLAVLR